MKSRLDILTAQIDSLSTKLEEKDKEMVFQESQLKEMKNMNAALENQLTEYMDALELQNKVQQCTCTCMSTYTVCIHTLSHPSTAGIGRNMSCALGDFHF